MRLTRSRLSSSEARGACPYHAGRQQGMASLEKPVRSTHDQPMSQDPDDSVVLTLPAIHLAGQGISSPSGEIRVPGWEIPEREVVISPSQVAELIGSARGAARKAYAFYSNFHVGTALVMADDPEKRVFSAANIENASYGATICAERNAIQSAVATGFRRIGLLAVSTVDSLDGPIEARSPCGLCRQVMREFSDGNTLIVIDHGRDGVLGEVIDIDRLLPWGFALGG